MKMYNAHVSSKSDHKPPHGQTKKGSPKELNQKKPKALTRTETEHLTQWRTPNTPISPPVNDGRWDMDRSTETNFNPSKIYIFLFYHKNCQSAITLQRSRKLTDTLARISVRMSTSGEQEWNTATINIQRHRLSQAQRHQPLIHGDPIDPYYNSWVGFCVWCSSMVVGAAQRQQTSAVVFLTVCSVICLVAFFACLEFPFVAGSCWWRPGVVMFPSVSVAVLLLL